MIQFKWRRLAHNEILKTEGIVTVDGHACVLEFKQLFMPTEQEVLVDDCLNSEAIVVLTDARAEDRQWKEVTIK